MEGQFAKGGCRVVDVKGMWGGSHECLSGGGTGMKGVGKDGWFKPTQEEYI